MQQMNLGKTNWKFRFSYGGVLRQKRAGRGQRPLSSREPLHLVLKVRREKVKYGLRTWKRFTLIHFLLKKYASKFFIKVEQVSIQGDHLHLLIRTSRRSNFQSFFRVFAGQIAQQFQKEGLLTVERNARMTDTPASQAPSKQTSTKGLWRYRPFTRVVRGYRAYKIVRDYVQLNEKEALGQIPYRAERLKGLSNSEWEILWT